MPAPMSVPAPAIAAMPESPSKLDSIRARGPLRGQLLLLGPAFVAAIAYGAGPVRRPPLDPDRRRTPCPRWTADRPHPRPDHGQTAEQPHRTHRHAAAGLVDDPHRRWRRAPLLQRTPLGRVLRRVGAGPNEARAWYSRPDATRPQQYGLRYR